MEDASKIQDPGLQESAPPMPYAPQEPPLPYAQGDMAPAYHYPNQYAPVPQQPVVYQPPHVVTMGHAPPLQPTYSDYIAWSIVNMLFCCLPLGIAALVFSIKTQDAIARNDLFSARSHSATARGLNISAMVLGILGFIFLIVYLVVIQQFLYYRYASGTRYDGY